MQKLVLGVHHFQKNVFGTNPEFFQHLAEQQNPETLFITCSDSRLDPGLLTQANPGELFMIRNAGNLIPPYSISQSSEAAAIEYAVHTFQIHHIIVCGHSNCGAMQALLHPHLTDKLPAMRTWLSFAKQTKRIVEQNYASYTEAQMLDIAILENILVQLEVLAAYPFVSQKIDEGSLRLHGWMFDIGRGEVSVYDTRSGQFLPLKTVKCPPISKRRLHTIEL